MSELKERLEGILRFPAATVADAERAAQAAEALATYLRLEEHVSHLLGERDDRDHAEQSADEPLKGMTLHHAAEQVLEEAKVALHVRELGKRIKAGGWTHKRSANPRPDQILYQLAARLPRHPDVFVRVAPNTFALREWTYDAKEQPRPRLGLFGGAGKTSAREIGDRPDMAAASGEWRSS